MATYIRLRATMIADCPLSVEYASAELNSLATVKSGVVQIASRAMLMRLRTLSRSVTLSCWRSLLTCDADIQTAGLVYIMVVSRGARADAWNSLAPVSSRIRRKLRSVMPPPITCHDSTTNITSTTVQSRLNTLWAPSRDAKGVIGKGNWGGSPLLQIRGSGAAS